MDPAELTVYADLIQILGSGEAACLSLAQCRQWLIAADEKKKFRRETLARLGAGRLLNTPGILTLAISSGILTVEDADRAKAVLEQHRFIMSFRDYRRRTSRKERKLMMKRCCSSTAFATPLHHEFSFLSRGSSPIVSTSGARLILPINQ